VSTHTLPHRVDDAGNITTGGKRKRWFKLVSTLDDEGIWEVYATGFEADTYLLRPRLRKVYFFEYQGGRRAVILTDYCFHDYRSGRLEP
jgi:hypothetical protein